MCILKLSKPQPEFVEVGFHAFEGLIERWVQVGTCLDL